MCYIRKCVYIYIYVILWWLDTYLSPQFSWQNEPLFSACFPHLPARQGHQAFVAESQLQHRIPCSEFSRKICRNCGFYVNPIKNQCWLQSWTNLIRGCILRQRQQDPESTTAISERSYLPMVGHPKHQKIMGRKYGPQIMTISGQRKWTIPTWGSQNFDPLPPYPATFFLTATPNNWKERLNTLDWFTWSLPKIGVPPVIIRFNVGFPIWNHPAIGVPGYGNPHIHDPNRHLWEALKAGWSTWPGSFFGFFYSWIPDAPCMICMEYLPT